MGLTPLHWAVTCSSGKLRLECVKILIKAGVDLEAQNRVGNTALHYAAATRKAECMECLLDGGADVNRQGEKSLQTPLHFAANAGDVDSVRLCINRGADINAVDVNGDSALHLCSRKGAQACIDTLIESGADVGLKNIKGISAGDEKEGEIVNESYEQRGAKG